MQELEHKTIDYCAIMRIEGDWVSFYRDDIYVMRMPLIDVWDALVNELHRQYGDGSPLPDLFRRQQEANFLMLKRKRTIEEALDKEETL